jgi:hypothetical protein
VVISHLTGDLAPGLVAAGVGAYNDMVPAGVTARTHAEVTALFGGLSLVPPGVVPVTEWRSSTGPAARADLYAGMARKWPISRRHAHPSSAGTAGVTRRGSGSPP